MDIVSPSVCDMDISKYRRGPRAGAALPIDFTMSREDYRRWTQLLFHGMHMGVRHPPGITFTGGVRVRLHVGVVANNGLFQVSVKSLCLWGRLGLITRALGISIRPDPELALALAQPRPTPARRRARARPRPQAWPRPHSSIHE